MNQAKPGRIAGQYRQGDVLIERVKRIIRKPSKANRLKKIVLAEGEATGHAHTLLAGERHRADWWKDEGGQFADLGTQAVVTHQEHGPIQLEPGTYRIVRQREYSPEAIRNVAD